MQTETETAHKISVITAALLPEPVRPDNHDMVGICQLTERATHGVSLLPDWFWCKKVYPLVPERILIVPQKTLLFEPEESRCGRRTFFLCKSLLRDAEVYS